jgi:hypothetical protein
LGTIEEVEKLGVELNVRGLGDVENFGQREIVIRGSGRPQKGFNLIFVVLGKSTGGLPPKVV